MLWELQRNQYQRCRASCVRWRISQNPKERLLKRRRRRRKVKLIFQNSIGEEIVIAEPSNREEVNKEINKFLDDHNFKSYYTRVWEENGRLIFDVGSHTEFFVLEGMNFEEWSNNK